jgi:hypothetical protein
MNGGIGVKMIKRIITLLIVLVFLFGLLPSALAVDGESVLTSVMHQDADTYYLSGDSRNITLTVRNSYAGDTLDLMNGLNIDWNHSWYRSVVATPEFATVDIDGVDVVELTVTFNRSTEAEGTPQWETVYNVRAVRADSVEPVFSGSVSKELLYSTGNHTVSFSSADFIPKYSNIDGEDIGSIAITGSNPTFGAVQVGGVNYNLNTHPCISIDTVNPDNTLFTFEATSNGTVSYNVSAYAGADTTTPIGNVVVTILSYKAPVINTPIAQNISKGTVLTFTGAYFASLCNLYGVPLESVEITPTNSTFGTWYLGTKAFTAVTIIPADQLWSLTFTASAAGTATFTWRVTAKSIASAPGAGTFTITSPKLTLSPYASTDSIVKGGTAYSLSSGDFVYTPATAPLAYIKITTMPTANDGYLYLSVALPKNDTYGYPAITANTALPSNAVIPAAYLNYLRLATKNTSTNTAISFKWTATADAKVSTAVWGEATTYTVPFTSGGILPAMPPYYYETDMNIPLPLASGDIVSRFSSLAGEPLSYVTFKVPDKNYGTLYFNYDYAKKTGTAVAATTKYYASKTPNLSKITFVPAKDYTGTTDITYSAYTESGAVITGQIRIKVSSNPGGTLSYITDKNSPIQLDATDFQSAFLSTTREALSYVEFSTLPASSNGYLCYNHTLEGDFDRAVSAGEKYYVNKTSLLSLVTFIPDHDFTGRVVINFTGYSENHPYTGKLYIYVVDSPAGIVQYSVKENGSAALSSDDFSSEFIGVTGSLMSYVTFTPPAATVGSMYLNYDADTGTGTKVAAAIKFYDGKGPDISDITFVPIKDFTGIVTVPYTAYATNGTAYAGKLRFTVFEGSNVITYNTDAGKSVRMNANDFANAFYTNSDGKALSYVTLQIPSASYGKFYNLYTSPTHYDSLVSSGQKYYVSASPYLSNISFVPQEGYTGSFTVTYTGYTSSGSSYTGKIKITVSGTTNGTVSYETNSMTPATFRTADFITAFAGKTGNPLYYVRFTQPSASFGILYQNYNPQSVYNTQVQPTYTYYTNFSTFISDVTFVPNPAFSGVLAISYTAYDAYGYSFNGTVLMTVTSSDIGTITYGTNMNTPIRLDSDDFSAAFMSKTGISLSYVTFTLPSSSAGALYLGYQSPTSYTAAVSASAKYYRTFSPLLSNITFVPAAGYSGAVTIPYVGYTAGNAAYYGKIIFNVGVSVPYTDMGAHTWAKTAVDYLYRNGVITDNGSGLYYPGANTTRGDYMVMIVNAFHLSGAGTDNFPDVPSGSSYYDAISDAKAFGIALGADDGLFHPEWGLTRQDAMVIIARALRNTGTPLTPGAMSDLAGFPDASQTSGYAVADLAALVRYGFVAGSGGNLNPKATFTRAESAMLLYRILLI